jgi:hypothetical protein
LYVGTTISACGMAARTIAIRRLRRNALCSRW